MKERYGITVRPAGGCVPWVCGVAEGVRCGWFGGGDGEAGLRVGVAAGMKLVGFKGVE